MKLQIWTILFFFGCVTLTGQEYYRGVVRDANTQEPLPYVNIGIISKGVGTVSDEKGLFELPLVLERFSANDTLQFSSLGYATVKKAVKQLRFTGNESKTIVMQPEVTQLSEVVLTKVGGEGFEELVGYQNYGEKVYGYWKDNVALGGELATRIGIKKGLRKLNYLLFEVASSTTDSVLVRINIYDTDGGQKRPGTNLNGSNKSILYTIRSDTKIATVNLAPYEIYVKNDFYVSLELLKVFGDKPIGLTLLATENRYTSSYRKFSSLADWEKIPDAAMVYYLNTTFYGPDKKRNSKVAKSTKSNNQTISGFVFLSGRGIANAKILNYSSREEVTTDANGRYKIIGRPGDVIAVTAPGMEPQTLKISEKTRLNINMVPK